MNQISPIRSVFIITVLTASIFCMGMTIGLVGALLVDMSGEFDTSVGTVGQILTVSAVVAGIIAPVMGPFSDKLGRKRLLIAGLAILGISYICYGLSWNFSALMGFSILVGFGTAIIMPNALSSIGDYFPAPRHGLMMGFINLGVPMATVGGVPLGALIANTYGWQMSFHCLGVFILVLALSVFIIFPTIQPAAPVHGISYMSKLREAFNQKRVFYLLSANILMVGTFQLIDIYLVAYIMTSYALNVGEAAPLIAIMATGQFAGTIIGGHLSDRFNKLKVCTVSICATGITGLFLMLFPNYLWLSVVLGLFLKGIYSSTRPAYFSLIISIAPKARGALMGFSDTSIQVGRSIGSLIGGLVITFLGYPYLGIICFIISIAAVSILTYVIRSHMSDSQDTAENQ